ncbi:MAG TPA: hypothetical protein VJR06_00155 [Nitrososphaerales archaeon]|nr:hypothetical protein [Nitrososphaerales archaeon]
MAILARVAWRTFASYRGTRFRLSRTYIYTGIYVLIGVVFSVISYTEGVPYLLAAPEAMLAALAAVGSYMYSDRRISFWKGSAGELYFRGGVIIYLVYLVALVIRIGLDVAIVGPSAFNIGPSVVLSGVGLYATMGTDLLLTFGVGLLIGRSVRVAQRCARISRGEEKVPDSPPA